MLNSKNLELLHNDLDYKVKSYLQHFVNVSSKLKIMLNITFTSIIIIKFST